MRTAHQPLTLAVLGLGTALSLSACSLLPDQASHANGPYPQTVDSPYGSATITAQPEKIAVTSSIDFDIAVALGEDPVVAPALSDKKASPWAAEALDDAGRDTPALYDAEKGPDVEAIREAQPDVILATGLDDVAEHFDELSDIAPVVAAEDDATWTDRTAAVATALNKAKEAESSVNDINAEAEEVAAHHLEFEDTTYARADVTADSIDYLSYSGSDDSFFTGIGMFQNSAAEDYSAKKHSVTKPQVDQLDADVLLIHFPDVGQTMLDEDELEDPFYREVKVIRGKHYTVLDDNTFAALTNLSPLSYDWLLQGFPDDLGKAEQGVL
ncbi:ABC transporter substrate-binding protein [Brevibacterium sp. CBA3109]|uniref:ABC transporter substrate-binding protein n=1 Tax=Brevibacterium koreense TaxID=3140787 RepID=A0AAU7UK24_9MICO